MRLKVLDVQFTEEKNPNLRKCISGKLELNYKNNNDFPDFGFVNNCYVPKYLLEKHHIKENLNVKAVVIFVGAQWKVVNIEEINPNY